VSSLERTLYSVFPPMMEGHDKPLWRRVSDGGLSDALLHYKNLKNFYSNADLRILASPP